MSDSGLISLYSGRILQLTTQIPHLGQLAGAMGVGAARSPHCGSRVSVQVSLKGTQIDGFAQEVKACALGQASAAIFGAAVLGQETSDLAVLRQQVSAMLGAGGPPPAAPFADYALLMVAAEYKNRHASILLCIDATIAACEAART